MTNSVVQKPKVRAGLTSPFRGGGQVSRAVARGLMTEAQPRELFKDSREPGMPSLHHLLAQAENI